MGDLEKIYMERKERMIQLMYGEGKSWEQARKIIDKSDYQERIDKLIYPQGKKKDYTPTIGETHHIFAVLGCNSNYTEDEKRKYNMGGGGYFCKKSDTKINGKAVYSRIFIKRVGYETFLGYDEDGNEMWDCVFDNFEDEDELNEQLKNFGPLLKI